MMRKCDKRRGAKARMFTAQTTAMKASVAMNRMPSFIRLMTATQRSYSGKSLIGSDQQPRFRFDFISGLVTAPAIVVCELNQALLLKALESALDARLTAER